uniref:Baculovirus polyhedron envelope protein PEP N-terminal domain-containing protein n=1 Tax=Cryptophlebia leucotreta granulosis virus TaxID=35254 RepID=A0A2H4ZKD9_GVCL|nr:hypothetical protein [Cryptophlebia leucotreta granulovirus]
MASIPADSKAFIKPFEGTDVTCLILDVVAWFGADEILSILNQNLCSALKYLPTSQKALWKQLEPQVQSEKQFITSLGVRLLIGRSQNIECHTDHHHKRCRSPSPHRKKCRSPSPRRKHQENCQTVSYYHNTPIDPYPTSSTSTVCHNQPRFELSTRLHNLGNTFIDEAIYDVRAYPQLDEVNVKINRIYDILLERGNETTVTA